MIRINQIKLPIHHGEEELLNGAAKKLGIAPSDILSVKIVRQSVDARKKKELLYSYVLDVELGPDKQKKVLAKKGKTNDIILADQKSYRFPQPGKERLTHPPVIIGSGPAGLFCGLMLARAGYCPVIFERGQDVDSRTKKVDVFWKTGELDQNSNVQFGEGGAGTFSDGKLNTLVKDPLMRNKKVLELFVEFGADPSILFKNKPHIGTDVLSRIVKNMREEIIRLGGKVEFESQITDFKIEDGRLRGITVGGSRFLETEALVLAIGHSARDTFETLLSLGVPMEAKAFAVGFRIQHSQQMINLSQYGDRDTKILGAADYKVTCQSNGGRGVYSFCMCPGGYVVDASSEPGRLAVNGMSNHDRNGENANSALIVTVTPEDFGGGSPLAGISYQRSLEETAYRCGNGKIPVQLFGDFRAGKETKEFGGVSPQFMGRYEMGNLRKEFPAYLTDTLVEAVDTFDRMIAGFGRHDAILSGIESRTSSPVRIHRDGNMESTVKGLYPCGEGAGYAGGITSAAMDGIKAAEQIASRYERLQNSK